LQSKIYLTLVRSGRLTVKQLANEAGVDRANTYREILDLEKIGLVKKAIAMPCIFEAAPLRDATSILLDRKVSEFKEIEKATKELLEKFSHAGNANLQDDRDFVLVPAKAVFVNTAIRNISNTQVSNETITNLKRFSQGLSWAFEAHKEALKKGVKTRIIVERPVNEKAVSEEMYALMAYPNFQMKYVLMPNVVLGACFDSAKVSILVDPTANVTDSASLRSNHRSLIMLFQNYFEDLWKSGIPIKPTEKESLQNSLSNQKRDTQ
jgi:sugar-specific transcriptional regulator TrmB